MPYSSKMSGCTQIKIEYCHKLSTPEPSVGHGSQVRVAPIRATFYIQISHLMFYYIKLNKHMTSWQTYFTYIFKRFSLITFLYIILVNSSVTLFLWSSVEQLQGAMVDVIPQGSPWEEIQVGDKDTAKSSNPDSTTAPRRRPIGYPTTRRSSRGRPPFPAVGRGRGQFEPFGREYYERYNPYEMYWGFAPEGYSSGPGRTSGGVRERGKDSPQRPGFKTTNN